MAQDLATSAYQFLPIEAVERKVACLAREFLGLSKAVVSLNDELIRDLGFDSLEILEFILVLERQFQCQFPDHRQDELVKSVFTRPHVRLADFAEVVYMYQGLGKDSWIRPAKGKNSPTTPRLPAPFSQLGPRWSEPRERSEQPLYTKLTDSPFPVYRRSSDGMRTVLIPSSSVTLGTDDSPDTPDVGPQHQVELDAFLIDLEPVSVTAYCRFLSHVGCTDDSVLEDWFLLPAWDKRQAQLPIGRHGREFQPVAGMERMPMVLVSWYGANAYSLWTNGQDWRRYRGDDPMSLSFLPSEAQWEYAARGAAWRRYPWGNDFDESLAQAGCHSVGQGYESAVEMPLLPVNEPTGLSPFGLHHMAGNVWQWCRDWYDPNFYRRPESRRPNPCQTAVTAVRSERGGSWVGPGELCQSSYRRGRQPDARGRCLGFRCVGKPVE